MPKLIPVPDEVSKPFWDACNERRLMLQNCTACNRLQHPPEAKCSECGSADHLEWREMSGRGKIISHCVVHDSRQLLRSPDQPFNIGVITLEEDPGINFLSNLPGTPVDEVPVGASVQVEYELVMPGQLIHEWRVMS